MIETQFDNTAIFMLWLIRFLCGERFRKATREENRIGSALFVLLPIFMVAGIEVNSDAFFNHAGGVVLWVCAVVGMVLLLSVAVFWARYIPARFSYLVAAVLWPMAFWMGWHAGMAGRHAH
jgi:hypothetical protein